MPASGAHPVSQPSSSTRSGRPGHVTGPLIGESTRPDTRRRTAMPARTQARQRGPMPPNAGR